MTMTVKELVEKFINLLRSLEKEIMIKITAEIDGKQVPLKNISTETFEIAKALEKRKEIPVAGTGNYQGNLSDRRLFLRLNDSIRNMVACKDIAAIAINLRHGNVANEWTTDELNPDYFDGPYENIKPL